jgi:hypothetical protein
MGHRLWEKREKAGMRLWVMGLGYCKQNRFQVRGYW